ncbi:MAG: DNA polymerase I [Gammaproteobacteria bacterium]|nr:DNA polymerase I [Gammaproteobacteria bacterium]
MLPDSSQKKLVLVDGSNLLYRAYHALGREPLTTSDGRTTQAIFGMINMLKNLLKDGKTRYMAVVMDAKGKTFRHERYPPYKATRDAMPDDLIYQKEYLERIIPAMGLKMLSVPGVEADDVIGTLAIQGHQQGFFVEIISSDKDLAQLISDDIHMVDTRNNTRMDVSGVKEKFGIPPELITDYLALAGDQSDNIPGIPGVGGKTALKWLDQFGDLNEIKAQAETITGKVGENLRNNLEQMDLFLELVTIDCDVELSLRPEDLTVCEPEQGNLKEYFEDLEFRTLTGEIAGGSGSKNGQADKQAEASGYATILDEKDLDQWISELAASSIIALDTETTSLDPHQAELVGLSFSVEPGNAAYLPLIHSYVGVPDQLPMKPALSKLKQVLEDPKQAKTGQNLKFDIEVLRRYGITVRGVTHDTMLMSYVLDAGSSRHDLDTLAKKHLNKDTVKFKDIAGTGKNQLTFDQIPLDTASHYAAEDADIALQLHHLLSEKIQQHEGLNKVFTSIEMPLLDVLVKTESNGVKVDADMLHRQSREIADKLVELESHAHEMVGKPFNMNSPSQIQEILFTDLQLPVIKKTPKGQPSTAESVLQDLAADFELPEVILEYRGLAKLKSTYTDKLPTLINPQTGRIHTSYHQAVASTGRLSSSDPNLQNIPVRSKEGRRIREAFIAEPGNLILSADYSQIELRIMAHLSGDQGLVSAFHDGADVHTRTAAEVFSVKPELVDAEQRRRAKAINFGLIYGMTAFGLARQLHINQGVAKNYIDIYFERYPGVLEYMEKSKENARSKGFVGTLFGRRLNLPDIHAKNQSVRQYAERTAINAPMQGTAADLIKLAMIEIDRWISSQPNLKTMMIMQVHDELVFEVPRHEVDEITNKVREIMCHIAELNVPLVVDVGVGANWKEAH